MTQLDLQNKFATLKDYISTEYELLAKQAALQVSAIRGGAEQVVLQVATDAEAIIETKIGTITFNGEPISSTPQYEALITALHRALGEQPSAAPATTVTATESTLTTQSVTVQAPAVAPQATDQAAPAVDTASSTSTTGTANATISTTDCASGTCNTP